MNRIWMSAAALLALAACATSSPPVVNPGLEAPAVADTPINSASGIYMVDPQHTSVIWKVQHLGLALFVGRFDTSGGELDLDAQSPTKSKVKFTIDVNSLSTDLPASIRQKFDAAIERGIGIEKTPVITFIATNLVRTGPQTGRMSGDLTLNGVTKPATFTVTLRGEGSNPVFGAGLGVEARGTIRRSDWGVDYQKAFVGDDVTIEIDSELHKKG